LRTGKIVGVEALLRWHHPERGILLPGEFIQAAKQLGLLEPIGYWVLNRLCLDIAKMDAMKIPPLRVSLNVAHEQFMAPNFVSTVESILSSMKISASRFEFELAESAVVANLDDIADDMVLLEKQGIRFALDGFGTGYSSLPQLQKLPITTLKLDKSYVQKVTVDKDSASVVRAMIYMAHGLELTVVGEGVETEEQKAFLVKNRCDHLQGFFYSQPLTFDDFTQLLNSEGTTARRTYLSVVDK